MNISDIPDWVELLLIVIGWAVLHYNQRSLGREQREFELRLEGLRQDFEKAQQALRRSFEMELQALGQVTPAKLGDIDRIRGWFETGNEIHGSIVNRWEEIGHSEVPSSVELNWDEIEQRVEEWRTRARSVFPLAEMLEPLSTEDITEKSESGILMPKGDKLLLPTIVSLYESAVASDAKHLKDVYDDIMRRPHDYPPGGFAANDKWDFGLGFETQRTLAIGFRELSRVRDSLIGRETVEENANEPLPSTHRKYDG